MPLYCFFCGTPGSNRHYACQCDQSAPRVGEPHARNTEAAAAQRERNIALNNSDGPPGARGRPSLQFRPATPPAFVAARQQLLQRADAARAAPPPVSAPAPARAPAAASRDAARRSPRAVSHDPASHEHRRFCYACRRSWRATGRASPADAAPQAPADAAVAGSPRRRGRRGGRRERARRAARAARDGAAETSASASDAGAVLGTRGDACSPPGSSASCSSHDSADFLLHAAHCVTCTRRARREAGALAPAAPHAAQCMVCYRIWQGADRDAVAEQYWQHQCDEIAMDVAAAAAEPAIIDGSPPPLPAPRAAPLPPPALPAAPSARAAADAAVPVDDASFRSGRQSPGGRYRASRK